jgi:hypothetical protein
VEVAEFQKYEVVDPIDSDQPGEAEALPGSAAVPGSCCRAPITIKLLSNAVSVDSKYHFPLVGQIVE